MSRQPKERPYILDNGQASIKYYWDKDGRLRDWRGFYVCPDCMFFSVSIPSDDIDAHVQTCHRQAGMFFGNRRPRDWLENPRVFGPEEPFEKPQSKGKAAIKVEDFM